MVRYLIEDRSEGRPWLALLHFCSSRRDPSYSTASVSAAKLREGGAERSSEAFLRLRKYLNKKKVFVSWKEVADCDGG